MTTELMAWLQTGNRPEDLPGFAPMLDELLMVEVEGAPGRPASYYEAEMATVAPPIWQDDPDGWVVHNRFTADLLADEDTRTTFLGALQPGTRAMFDGEVADSRRPVLLERVAFDRSCACDACAGVVPAGQEVVRLESRREDRYIESCVILCGGCVSDAASKLAGVLR